MIATFPGGFAVLMAVYEKDDPSLLRMAINSILANSLVPDEIWIIVDGPLTNDLEDVLASYAARYSAHFIRIQRIKERKGLANALNEGLASISLPWIARADADDINLTNRFECQARYLNLNPNIDLLGSAIIEVTRDGDPISTRLVPISHPDIYEYASYRNPFNHMSVVYKRESVLNAGCYPSVYLKEDYALWCKMLAAGFQVANIPDVLVKATTGMDMYARRGGWKYAISEYTMQRILVDCELKSLRRALLDGLLRSLVFLAPTAIRRWIYLNILRLKSS